MASLVHISGCIRGHRDALEFPDSPLACNKSAGGGRSLQGSLGYDDSSGLQQDALPLAFGIHLTHFAFQVTSNCWLLFIWKMLIVHLFCSAVFR